MGFLKSSSPAEVTEVTEVAAEPEDIEFVDEDLEAEPDEIIDDRPPGFDGPRTWEEVEENESQRVSLSISTHAVPSNDSGEAAARLAWQAAVLESDNQDPLGLGRIDGHGLRLVSGSMTYFTPLINSVIGAVLQTHVCVLVGASRQSNYQARRHQAQCKSLLYVCDQEVKAYCQ